MATLSITTTEGRQNYGSAVASDGVGVDIWRTQQTFTLPERIGYFWLFLDDSGGVGKYQLFARGAVYLPGMFYNFGLPFSVVGASIIFVADWDIPGIALTVEY